MTYKRAKRVSPFPAGDHKAMSRHDSMTDKKHKYQKGSTKVIFFGTIFESPLLSYVIRKPRTSGTHLNPYPATIFVSENVFCFSRLRHIFKRTLDQIFSGKQTLWTLIRLLPRSSLIWVHIVCNCGYLRK